MNKLNIAIIGAGWWASYNHIPTLKNNNSVGRIIVVDNQEERLAIVKEKLHVDATYTDMDEMLEKENVQGAIIATPHTAHYAPAIKCIQKGINILIEKPMTTTIGDARNLADLAKSNGVEVMVACGWNYTHYMLKAHQRIKEGKIGKIRHVVAQMASPTGDLFNGEPLKGTESAIFRPPSSTWADPENAGGYSWGQMSHLLAALFYLIDEDPQSVYSNFQLSSAGVDYYDSAVLKTDKGTTVCLSGASTMPGHRGYMMDIRIFGTEGVLVFDIERERMEVMVDDGDDIENVMAPGEGQYPEQPPVERFVQLCKGEKVHNPADATVGLRSVETLYLMHQSAKSGKVEFLH
ncbi:MAG: Gfo/Idh/MocA family oxidoreductase [Chitinophagaceae bacterium]|nr:Gfo/Idh/MocA family oxidoreductase [Chitinophagaceae bacterium]